ncbi:hypothetical protein NPIL_622791 [Nephila pilipes]|uniref:Uncharacterized protein n=1 Tax=Nephila pilipes TaxID=299642 RepID=A0A8X6PHJ4_NEPPI|nr:hypothetical protein NPIL_622791 [Nephila pilipes]
MISQVKVGPLKNYVGKGKVSCNEYYSSNPQGSVEWLEILSPYIIWIWVSFNVCILNLSSVVDLLRDNSYHTQCCDALNLSDDMSCCSTIARANTRISAS